LKLSTMSASGRSNTCCTLDGASSASLGINNGVFSTWIEPKMQSMWDKLCKASVAVTPTIRLRSTHCPKSICSYSLGWFRFIPWNSQFELFPIKLTSIQLHGWDPMNIQGSSVRFFNTRWIHFYKHSYRTCRCDLIRLLSTSWLIWTYWYKLEASVRYLCLWLCRNIWIIISVRVAAHYRNHRCRPRFLAPPATFQKRLCVILSPVG
jgi:hypothetical protein